MRCLRWVAAAMIVGCLCLFSGQVGFADTISLEDAFLAPDRQYRFAQALFNEGRYVRAAVEFERFVSFFPEDSRVPESRFKAADAYLKAGQYQEAVNFCKKVIGENPAAPDTAKFYMLLVRCRIKQNDFSQVLVTLHNILSIYQEPGIRDEARYLGAWVFIETGQWAKARNWLKSISSQNRDHYQVDTLTRELSLADSIPYKSPGMAGFFAVLPGAGHLYTRRYQDALISFLFNTLTIWATYEAFDHEQPALGSLLGLAAVSFYTGNIYSAVNSAHKFNRGATEAFIRRLNRRAPVRWSLGPTGDGGFFRVSIDF